ncbi:MAG: hypothetical protein KDB14_19395 [Planctomycetales bacterium]|nr:hypothetical protein [Planctomycetales bacterium]
MLRHSDWIVCTAGNWLALAVVVSSAVTSFGQEPPLPANTAIALTSPANGAYVGVLHKVHGQLAQRGQPIVLVRVQQPGAPWWVQEPALPTAPGRFMSASQFGNGETPDGVQFEVLALLALNPAQAAPFKVGRALATLPPELPRSAVIVVTRGAAPAADGAAVVNFAIPEAVQDAAPLPGPLGLQALPLGQVIDAPPMPGNGLAANPPPGQAVGIGMDQEDVGQEATEGTVDEQIVLSPAPLAEVGEVFEIQGQAPLATQPVVLLRPNVEHGVWRIQGKPHVEPDGTFRVRMRCGNERTPSGTQFRFVVLLPVTNQQVRPLSIGKTLKALPINMPHSREIIVKRGQ